MSTMRQMHVWLYFSRSTHIFFFTKRSVIDYDAHQRQEHRKCKPSITSELKRTLEAEVSKGQQATCAVRHMHCAQKIFFFSSVGSSQIQVGTSSEVSLNQWKTQNCNPFYTPHWATAVHKYLMTKRQHHASLYPSHPTFHPCNACPSFPPPPSRRSPPQTATQADRDRRQRDVHPRSVAPYEYDLIRSCRTAAATDARDNNAPAAAATARAAGPCRGTARVRTACVDG